MKVRTGIKWVAAIMLMVVLCFSVTVAVKGYGMYREAVDSISPVSYTHLTLPTT